MARYYFIPTDEILYACQHPNNRDEDACNFCALHFAREERCFIYKIYGRKCTLEDERTRIVGAHHYFLSNLMRVLKENNINKYNCTTEKAIDNILLFIGLYPRYDAYNKYILKSSYIFDWSKQLIRHNFEFVDKLAYYHFIATDPDHEINETRKYFPTYFKAQTYQELYDRIEDNKTYLLKDIRGAGGAKIYPILKENNSILKLQSNNEIQPMEDAPPDQDFFVQEFKHPYSISGFDIIYHLLTLNNFEDIKRSLPALQRSVSNRNYILKNKIVTNFVLLHEHIKTININHIHNILISLYFSHYNIFETNFSDLSYLDLCNFLMYNHFNDIYTKFKNELNESELILKGINDFDTFVKLINVFYNLKKYMLKFRRPYIMFIDNAQTNIYINLINLI